MNKDSHLLFEAYKKALSPVSECWSAVQKKTYDALVKDGYKEVKKDESTKKITLVKKLDGTEKMITVDEKGDEHIHFNGEDSEAGEVNWHHKVNPTDHVEHGRRAAKWELQSGEKAHNPHPEGSQDAQDWDYGYHEELKIKKTEEASEEELGPDPKEVKELQDVMKHYKPEFKHTPFWDAYKAVKHGYWTDEEFHQWASSVWSDGADHALGMGENEEVTESKHTKKHIFAKVEKAAEKAGYSKKAALKIAGAAKAKALKKSK